MKRAISLLGALSLVLAACGQIGTTFTTKDGRTGLAKTYKVSKAKESKIQFRMLDAVNALRGASSLSPVELNASLNAAAATHSRDMSIQNRPWHFGSDGSSPVDRIRRAGYTGALIGEAISESFETELETLAAWMESPVTREVIMDPSAVAMGFSFQQEASGKIWWTMVLGGEGEQQPIADIPEFVSLQNPNPAEVAEDAAAEADTQG